MSKLIGIPLYNIDAESVGVRKPYMEYAKRYGTVILLSPDTFIPNLDLLILPGGKDVANGNKNDFSFENSDNERFLEWFDLNTLPKYIENGTPIYGICRGMQTICRHFDMPLVQDIKWDHGYSSNTEDLKAHGALYTEAIRNEARENGFSLPAKIESFHHQGIFTRDLHKDFELLCTSNESNADLRIVEFARHKTLPIVLQQGHPERSWGPLPHHLTMNIIK